MIHLAVITVLLISAAAERVPCGRGPLVCAQRSQTSVLGNTHFCCGDEFRMHLSSALVNGTQRTSCLCNRIYTESACMEGAAQCQGASSLMSVGGVVRCCPEGQAMTSFHNSLINGVMVDSCKCKAGNSGNTFMSSGFQFGHNSQTAQQVAPVMRMFHSNFQHGMNSMFSGMQQMMNQMDRHMDSMFPRMGFGLFPTPQAQDRYRGQGARGVSGVMAGLPAIARPGFWLGQTHNMMGFLPGTGGLGRMGYTGQTSNSPSTYTGQPSNSPSSYMGQGSNSPTTPPPTQNMPLI